MRRRQAAGDAGQSGSRRIERRDAANLPPFLARLTDCDVIALMFDQLVDKGFQVEFHSHAKAILSVDFPDAVQQLEEVLLGATIPIEEIIAGGGGEAKGTQRLRKGLAGHGWATKIFTIIKTINGVQREAVSHKMDHVREFEGADKKPTALALEIEWNNKDPFFDRD